MPSLSAIRTAPHVKSIYQRLVSKHNIKMKATVAAQWRLLELAYTLWKTNSDYHPNYLLSKTKVRADV